MLQRKLIILAKAPIAGHAKSRMIPMLGDEGAAQLHQEITRWMLQRLTGQQDYIVELWCASDIDHPFFKACAAEFNITLKLQEGDDLGERQFRAMTDGLKDKGHVVVIGSDVVSLTTDDIQHAFDVLQQGSELVIAPAEDGGYGLIGASKVVREIFSDILWGEDMVYAAMVGNLNGLGLNWDALPSVWDLDRPEDLLRLGSYPELPERVSALIDVNIANLKER